MTQQAKRIQRSRKDAPKTDAVLLTGYGNTKNIQVAAQRREELALMNEKQRLLDEEVVQQSADLA